jgi:hypothetical protein
MKKILFNITEVAWVITQDTPIQFPTQPLPKIVLSHLGGNWSWSYIDVIVETVFENID